MKTTIMTKDFSTTKGGECAKLFCMQNDRIKVELTNYGATIVSLFVPDKNNIQADVVLGFSEVKGYEENGGSLGSSVGRYANRISNSSFELNGVKYTLEKNDGENSLHGGFNGFHKRLWDYEIGQDYITFIMNDKDMAGGYPGNIVVKVTYTLTNCGLKIDYYGKSDKDTILNLTNHSYFNLKGHNNGDILDHYLKINSDYYTESNSSLIPTGKLKSVKDTPFDFNMPTKVGKRIDDDNIDIKNGAGYDHNYVLKQNGDNLFEAAMVYEETTGRVMTVLTNKPGIQLYTGNFLDGYVGKDGGIYNKRAGLCLETQFYPDTPNRPEFPTCVLKTGEEYKYSTVFEFSIK